MKIWQENDSASHIVAQDLEVVVHAQLGSNPEIFLKEGVTKLDRHFLVGLMQICTVAVEERDAAVVIFSPNDNVVLDANGEKKTICEGILIFRNKQGQVGCVCLHDPVSGRRIIRDALRRFTGTIRLDVP